MQMFGRSSPLSCSKTTLSSREAGRLGSVNNAEATVSVAEGDQVVRETPLLPGVVT